MKVVVLDDDPTGTQSASGVQVLLRPDAAALVDVLARRDVVYVLTNTRSRPEADAVALCRSLREAGRAVAGRTGDRVRFVLRGDSTLRGHTFAEVDVFATDRSVVLFLPAFPAGGRTTRDGVHRVRVDGRDVPVGGTEYARDPVFGYRTSALRDHVAEVGGGRPAIGVPLAAVRSGTGAVATALLTSPAGTVVCPDAVTDEDVAAVHTDLLAAWDAGRDVVVRCAAPLAARCAGVVSHGLLPVPLDVPAGPVLVVCGSHTAGAAAQLRRLEPRCGAPVVLDTGLALADPAAAAAVAVPVLRHALAGRGVAVLTSERVRAAGHATLEHGGLVMSGLTLAVAAVAAEVAVVVTKGGITAAEVAATGFGARTARVRGQVLPGTSVWELHVTGRHPVPHVVVPGNVGDERTLDDVLAAVRP